MAFIIDLMLTLSALMLLVASVAAFWGDGK